MDKTMQICKISFIFIFLSIFLRSESDYAENSDLQGKSGFLGFPPYLFIKINGVNFGSHIIHQ